MRREDVLQLLGPELGRLDRLEIIVSGGDPASLPDVATCRAGAAALAEIGDEEAMLTIFEESRETGEHVLSVAARRQVDTSDMTQDEAFEARYGRTMQEEAEAALVGASDLEPDDGRELGAVTTGILADDSPSADAAFTADEITDPNHPDYDHDDPFDLASNPDNFEPGTPEHAAAVASAFGDASEQDELESIT